MGISQETLRAHVEKYSTQFKNYRQHWQKYLYHHVSVENIVNLFNEGSLLSRDHAISKSLLVTDIAPSGIIDTRSEAHKFGRMYFRPLNPTQFHIEGIRKSANYYQGKHAGFLVMLLFDAGNVLTRKNTVFSCGNMQSSSSSVYSGDSGFLELNFSDIYHDSAYPSESVIRHRCAEVLVESPFSLRGSLSRIAVRTDADVQCMKFLLEENNHHWAVNLVQKSTSGGIFFGRYTALDFIEPSPGRINFQLKETRSEGEIDTSIVLSPKDGGLPVTLVKSGLLGGQKYYTEHSLHPGPFTASVSLEGCFAHRSTIQIE